MRIRDYIKKGMPSYQAFLKVQTHLLALGKAYSTELAYNTFMDYAESIENEKNRVLFHKLGGVFWRNEVKSNT